MFNAGEYQKRMQNPELKKHLADPKFKALVQAASSSLSEFFELIQVEIAKFPDHAETLVRKARLVLAFRVDEEPDEEHVIDLKTGPMPEMRTKARAKSDDQYDMIVSVDTRLRFVALMTQEEDGLEAYKKGYVRLVKGSMRALLKLRSLQELADRWREDLGLSDGIPGGAHEQSVLVPGASEDERSYQGYLEKQSDWLKKWNSRFVVLKWNEKSRPQLRFFSSQASSRSSPARHFVELHSGMECVPHSIQGEPLAFSVVDRRSAGRVLFVLRAPSERSLGEWMQAFSEAIMCRAKALETAKRRLRGESLSGITDSGLIAPGKGPAGGLLDLLLATQRVCTTHSEQLRLADEERRRARENIARLENRAQEAEEFLIYSIIESDLATIRKSLGWKFVPLLAIVLYVVKRTVEKSFYGLRGIAHRLGELLCSYVLPSVVTSRVDSSNIGVLGLLLSASVVAKYLTEHKSFELSRRRWHVYSLAVRVIWRLKLSSMKAEYLPPIHSAAMWNVEFRTNAELLYGLALNLRGLWVKTAQFLGARPDVVPETALHVLKRLHDDVPATPFNEVKQLVEADLAAPLTKNFSSFEESVLASASIGQVHVAHLLDGTKVVVKAQHPNVEAKILQDLKNMENIINWVEILEPDLEVKHLVQEWSREVSKELEFDKEAENMLDVGRNLASDPSVYAALPKPVAGLYTKRVLVMHFVPGAKVNDLDNLRRVSGVDTEQQRSNLAMDICNAFARQLFVDGIFQADAHPGNILVAARSALDPRAVQHLPPAPLDDPDRAIPILLDFGLTKRLPNSKRLAFSRLICAMQSLDIGQLLLSFDEMGLRLKREDPFEDLSELRFAFRETDTAENSRKETYEHVMKAKEKYDNLPRDQRNPVEAFPSELMLFFRTIFLLRGLCTSLNVRVKYLKTMSAWAKRALQEHTSAHAASVAMLDVSGSTSSQPVKSAKVETASVVVLPKLTPPRRNSLSLLVGDSLSMRLSMKCEQMQALGVQVHAVRFSKNNNSVVLANVAHGRLHHVDYRPITSETLFPCLSLGQGVAQIVGRAILEDKLNLKVRDVWTGFACENITIEGILSGDISQMGGLGMTTLPTKFSVATMHKWQDHLAFVRELVPETSSSSDDVQPALPWEMCSLAFTWGWVLAGTMQAMNPGSKTCVYEDTFSQQIATKLGGGILVRAPENELPLPAPKKGMSPREEEEMTTRRDAHRESVNSKYAMLSIDLEKLSGGAVDLDKMWDVQSPSEVPTTGSGFDISSVLRSLGPSFKGKEYLVDPRLMNTVSARSSVAPNCNLLATARGLTRLYASVGNEGALDGKQVVPVSVAKHFARDILHNTASNTSAVEPLGERLGVKVFELRPLNGAADSSSHTATIKGFGQVAFGGSLVLCVPSMGLALSVLVNDITLERELTRELVDEILRDVGLRLVSEI